VQTLIAGGSYVPSPAPSSSSSSSSSAYPPRRCSAHQHDPVTPALRSLLGETSDALDSPDGALVRSLCLDRLFSLASEKLEPAFQSSATPDASANAVDGRGVRFEDVTEQTVKLASLLPLLARLTNPQAEGSVFGNGVQGNEWTEALEEVRELREFSAVLYSSWDRDDTRRTV
jgi:peroxin-3